jgi:hypothetical protein
MSVPGITEFKARPDRAEDLISLLAAEGLKS